MSEGSAAGSTNVWLLCRSGACAGARFPLRDGTIRVGRAPDNDAVIDGPDAATVSLYHCEIVREDEGCRVRDRESTNGTWVDGERVTEAPITPAAVVRLGQQGPEFALVIQEAAPELLDRTMEIRAVEPPPAPMPPLPTAAHEESLIAAVDRARRMRGHGFGGETMTIMRDFLTEALRKTHRRHRTMAYALALAL